MKIEHTAIQVADPNAMAAWYCEHLGMRVRSRQEQEPYTHFLEDSAGEVLLEFYNNPKCPIPDYPNMDPLLIHIAFVSDDPRADEARLLAVGATKEEEVDVNGNLLIMLRDPWGLSIQLCRRAKPFFQPNKERNRP